MTKKELIEALADMPDDAEVVQEVICKDVYSDDIKITTFIAKVRARYDKDKNRIIIY